MSRFATPILAVALGVAAAVALVSCGGGGSDKGLLPGTTASEIISNLDSVKASAGSGDCTSASEQAATVLDQINELGGPVDHQLKLALRAGAEKLQSLVDTTCTDTTAESTKSQTTESETTATTEPTTTAETTTRSTSSQPTVTTDSQPTVPTTSTPTAVPPSNGGTPPVTGGHGPGKR